MARHQIGISVRRGWRRFRGRRVATQIVALVVALGVVGGVVAVGSAAIPSSSTKSAAGTPGANAGPAQAAPSTSGVTKDSVTVVFPVIDLSAIANASGLDVGDENSTQAITTFVDDVNTRGGINGRHFVARIEKFNPYDDADMRAKCKDWTQSGNVFAVIDATGAWTGDNQLCITQEGKTPLLSNWTTTTDWTRRGNPYLWWIGPDDSAVLRNLVHWATARHLLTKGVKYGILAGDRSSDAIALRNYLEPALRAAGLPAPEVETLSASTSDQATVQAQAPVAVARLKRNGVGTVIPLAPFNALRPYLAAATQQHYFPKLLLSDYESSVSLALGLAELQHPGALDGQLGTTSQTLGNLNRPHPTEYPGYPPGGVSCFDTWVAKHPDYARAEGQGPIMSWCEATRLFADAARKAGPNLDRRTFTDAMKTITDFDAALYPKLQYGSTRRAGASEYRVVRIHKNDRAHNGCPGRQLDGQPFGSCWLIVNDFRPMDISP